MIYSYNRQKVATIDLHEKFYAIVSRHEKEESREFEALLREVVKPLSDIGFDLDLRRSWLDKDFHGSDGYRLRGELTVKTQPGTFPMDDPREVAKAVDQAIDIWGSGRRNSDGSFTIDISQD